MDPTRFVLIYVVNGFIAAYLTIVVYRILRRNPKNSFNQIFSMAYISLLISIILNSIWALITEPSLEWLVNVLGDFTDYFIFLAAGFILLSLLILNYPDKMIKRTDQILFMLIYGGIASLMFFIPDDGHISISPDGIQSSPTMGINLFMFYMIFYSTSLLFTIMVAIKILKKLRDPQISKRFGFFILGVLLLYYFPFGMAFANYLNTEEIRQIHLFLSFLMLPGVYLIYYGIGSKIESGIRRKPRPLGRG